MNVPAPRYRLTPRGGWKAAKPAHRMRDDILVLGAARLAGLRDRKPQNVLSLSIDKGALVNSLSDTRRTWILLSPLGENRRNLFPSSVISRRAKRPRYSRGVAQRELSTYRLSSGPRRRLRSGSCVLRTESANIAPGRSSSPPDSSTSQTCSCPGDGCRSLISTASLPYVGRNGRIAQRNPRQGSLDATARRRGHAHRPDAARSDV